MSDFFEEFRNIIENHKKGGGDAGDGKLECANNAMYKSANYKNELGDKDKWLATCNTREIGGYSNASPRRQRRQVKNQYTNKEIGGIIKFLKKEGSNNKNKYFKFKNFILDKKKKKEFIDEHDLKLYHDEEINRITLKAEVYKGGGRLGNVDILFVAVTYNKRALTHKVSSSGLVLVSMPKDCYDEKIEKWDYVQVTGKIKAIDCYEVGKIPYIDVEKVKLLKKSLIQSS